MKKIDVSIKQRDSSENVDKLYDDLIACNRSIQSERNFMKQGRQGSASFPDLLKNKQTLEAQLNALGVQVSPHIGMRPSSATFFQSKGSAFSDFTKTKKEKDEKSIRMESNDFK